MSKPEPFIQKAQERTLKRSAMAVSVVIPAHNEERTIADVVAECQRGLNLLGTTGQVIVSASGCTDGTARVAQDAGAETVVSPAGKGAAIMAGVSHATGDVICLVDGDLEYYGDTPLVTLLVDPIIHGVADACISNLYWRPIYPDQWLHGFFAPLAGHICPELLPKCGSTPWSGQRAAVKPLWPQSLPNDFTSDLALLLHWNMQTSRLRPVLTDDWFNPLRPKPDQIRLDYRMMVEWGISNGRLDVTDRVPLDAWFAVVQRLVDEYEHDVDNPVEYERRALRESLAEFRRQMHRSDGRDSEGATRC